MCQLMVSVTLTGLRLASPAADVGNAAATGAGPGGTMGSSVQFRLDWSRLRSRKLAGAPKIYGICISRSTMCSGCAASTGQVAHANGDNAKDFRV